MKKLILLLSLLLATPCFADSASIPIATALTMVTTVHSIGVSMRDFSNLSIQAVWTETPTGTLQVQVSDDIVPLSTTADPAAKVVNWSNYTGQSFALTGAAGSTFFQLFNAGYAWVRLNYTAASGTGSLNAILVEKSN